LTTDGDAEEVSAKWMQAASMLGGAKSGGVRPAGHAYELLGWAEQHRFPALEMAPFLIEAGVEAWQIAALVGRAELIVAARRAIGLIEEHKAGAR
jgi:hypothetical protein